MAHIEIDARLRTITLLTIDGNNNSSEFFVSYSHVDYLNVCTSFIDALLKQNCLCHFSIFLCFTKVKSYCSRVTSFPCLLISWMTNITCFRSVCVSLYNAEPIVFSSSLICPCDKPCGDVIIPIKIHSVGNQPSSCLLPQSPSYTNTVWNP